MELASSNLQLQPGSYPHPSPRARTFSLLARCSNGQLTLAPTALGLAAENPSAELLRATPILSLSPPPDRHSPRDSFTRWTQAICVCCEVLCTIDQSRFRGGYTPPAGRTVLGKKKLVTAQSAILDYFPTNNRHCGQHDV